jgi:hypothetical protein
VFLAIVLKVLSKDVEEHSLFNTREALNDLKRALRQPHNRSPEFRTLTSVVFSPRPWAR